MAEGLNYPDVLGYITDGTRLNVNVLQIAAALKPPVVRAGRPLEMFVLMQNASDAELEVIATLRLPDRDAKKQRDRFVAKAERLRIGLPPAGVGVVKLPVSTLPDTAVGAGYKIGIEIRMKPVERGKPQRIRSTEEGLKFDPESLDEERQSTIDELKGLRWGNDRPALRNVTIEASLSVMSGKVGSFADLEPSWTSLWTVKDLSDEAALLKRLAPLIKAQVFPKFAHKHAFPLLLAATRNYFKRSGYKFTDIELETLTRLIYVPLRYARQEPRRLNASTIHYTIMPYLEEQYLDISDAPLNLPAWFSTFLKHLNSDERVARNPVKGIIHLMFEDLLRDALQLGLTQIATIARVDMGNAKEQAAYIDFVLSHTREGTLGFDLFYVPGVVGGVSIADDALGQGELTTDLAYAFENMLAARQPQVTEDYQATYEIAEKVIKYFADKFLAR